MTSFITNGDILFVCLTKVVYECIIKEAYTPQKYVICGRHCRISLINDNERKSDMKNKTKRIISSKLLSQENRLKRNSTNANSNSNIIESKHILKKGNSKNKKKFNKEQINKINNSNIIKIDINKSENMNLTSAKSSINIHSNNPKYNNYHSLFHQAAPFKYIASGKGRETYIIFQRGFYKKEL